MNERNNIRPRACKECGRSFLGGPRAWYCPDCRTERTKQQNKDFKMRKKAGKTIPVGSVIKCELCGKDIIKNSGLQKFCEECATKHLKSVDNQQSLEWKMNNPEKIRESKRSISKIRHSQEPVKSGVKGVHWDKGKQLWCACINLKGRQYKIVYSKDIALAIQARKEAESLNIQSVTDIYMLKSKYKILKDNLGEYNGKQNN